MTENQKAAAVNFAVAILAFGLAVLVCLYNPEPSSWNVFAIAWNVGTAIAFALRGADQL